MSRHLPGKEAEECSLSKGISHKIVSLAEGTANRIAPLPKGKASAKGKMLEGTLQSLWAVGSVLLAQKKSMLWEWLEMIWIPS